MKVLVGLLILFAVVIIAAAVWMNKRGKKAREKPEIERGQGSDDPPAPKEMAE
jgi:hypothetical protein